MKRPRHKCLKDGNKEEMFKEVKMSQMIKRKSLWIDSFGS